VKSDGVGYVLFILLLSLITWSQYYRSNMYVLLCLDIFDWSLSYV